MLIPTSFSSGKGTILFVASPYRLPWLPSGAKLKSPPWMAPRRFIFPKGPNQGRYSSYGVKEFLTFTAEAKGTRLYKPPSWYPQNSPRDRKSSSRILRHWKKSGEGREGANGGRRSKSLVPPLRKGNSWGRYPLPSFLF